MSAEQMHAEIGQLKQQLASASTQFAEMHSLIAGLQNVVASGGGGTAESRMADMMSKILAASSRPRGRPWDDPDRYKSTAGSFGGKGVSWEEWHNKMTGQIKAADVKVSRMFTMVENELTEKDVATEDMEPALGHLVPDEVEKDDYLNEVSAKLHSLLSQITNDDAHSVVSRCRGGNGFLAWKRLCDSSNPKTLATGVVMMKAVLNPQKVVDVRKAESMIEAGRRRW